MKEVKTPKKPLAYYYGIPCRLNRVISTCMRRKQLQVTNL